MDLTRKKELVQSYDRWYHAFDFGDGVQTNPIHPMPEIWKASEDFLDKIDFGCKSVLDIGCWDGYWSFYAEKKGATDVLATDIVDQRWGAPKGFEIAHKILDSKINYRGDVSVYDLQERIGKKYDIVIYFGVYYHLTQINYAFTQIRHVLKDGGIMLVEGAAINDTESPYCEYLYGDGEQPERVDRSNWFIPTRRCLRDMIESSYFEVTREEFPFDAPRGRSLMEAKAVRRVDKFHDYPPPFGLSQYDPRWS